MQEKKRGKQASFLIKLFEDGDCNREIRVDVFSERTFSCRIMSFLAFGYTCNTIIFSKATLKRFKVHLSHKSNYTDTVDVALFVLKELENSGQLHGYWWMDQKCLGTQCSV